MHLARLHTDDEHAGLRERVEAGSYAFLNAVQWDDAMPHGERPRLLARPSPRSLHGAKSIDDIDA